MGFIDYFVSAFFVPPCNIILSTVSEAWFISYSSHRLV